MNLKSISKSPATLALTLFTGLVVIYSFVVSFEVLPAYQWVIVFVLTLLSSVVYLFLDRASVKQGRFAVFVVLITYAVVAIGVFHPTMDNLFRSEHWIRVTGFYPPGGFSWEAIKEIVVLEFLGSKRFQPFAHLILLLRHLIFGYNIFLSHLLSIALHIITAFLIFLTVRRFTRNIGFAFLFGLLFVVLQSQFDIVVWTFHLYIILGIISFLAALLLALRYTETGRPVYLFISFLLSLISILFYEPSILAPVAIFLIVLFRGTEDKGEANIRGLKLPVVLVIVAYVCFLLITLYGKTLISGGSSVGVGTLLAWENLTLAVKGVIVNMWETNFIKNIGVAARIHIFDIVYIYLPDNLYGSAVNIIKLALAFLLIFFFRFTRANGRLIFILLMVALSYILIISLGRMQTNSISYLVSQPRYQYFINALFIVVAGMLLWRKYREKNLKPLIAVLLGAVFFWNAQNVLYANNMVDKEMDFLNAPYYKMKAFLDEEPSAKVYVNYAPLNELRFFLGSDIAFDMLFDGKVTRFSTEATHIFDGEGFKLNKARSEPSPYLEDFNLSWGYLKVVRKGVKPHEYTLVGSKQTYPSISITPDGFVAVRLRDARTGEIDTYRLREPLGLSSKRFAEMEVIKAGDNLCLRVNGLLTDRLTLRGRYDNWESDGRELLGEYYSGKGSSSYVTMLLIKREGESIRCR
ncbi:MAG: hypothetical protein IME98_03850 [Proteobacteria bacterium]|nr:hypothetical protein [Pseudomonadota bacterium]